MTSHFDMVLIVLTGRNRPRARLIQDRRFALGRRQGLCQAYERRSHSPSRGGATSPHRPRRIKGAAETTDRLDLYEAKDNRNIVASTRTRLQGSTEVSNEPDQPGRVREAVGGGDSRDDAGRTRQARRGSVSS